MSDSPPAIPDLPPLSRSDLFWLGAITALAFLLRLIYLDQSRACPLWGLLIMDARSYGEWSDKIVGTVGAGDWLGSTIFYQAPLYPYFLALVKLVVGHDLWNIRLVQIALGSLSCAIIALAGRRFFASRAAGYTAGFMLALYPPAIFFDTLIQKANLGLVWTSLLLYILARLARRPTILWAAALGATLALLALTREETLLLVPVLLLWLFLFKSEIRNPTSHILRRLLPPTAFLLSMSLLLLPVAIRNHHVGGEFVLTTSQAGPNFYIGNNPRADGMYAPLRPGRSNTPWERQDAIELAQADTGRTMSPGEVSRYWTSKALAYIRDNPGAWLRLEARKAAMLINSYEIPDAEDQYFFERYSGLLRALSRPWNLGVLLPIGVAGMVLAWRQREARILYLVAATLSLGIILFYVFARYRYPLIPVIILFAGAAPWLGLSSPSSPAWHGLSSPWRSRRTALALAAAALAAVASNWPLFPRDFQLAAAYSNAGAAVSESGHPDKALELFDQSLRLNPGLANTRAERALALARLGRLPEAVAELRKAVAHRPGDARLEFHLGTALAESGLFDEAAGHLACAVALGPTDVDARVNYGMLLLQFRNWDAAAEQLRLAAKLDPAAGAPTLAWLLATCPDPSVRDGPAALAIAAELSRKASNADPDVLDILGAAHAEAGQFTQAASAARAAIDAATRAGRADLAAELRARLVLYESGRPFRQQ